MAGRMVTPTARLIAPVSQLGDRDTFLAIRRQGIGGSDVAAILGLDEYDSPLKVYLDKTGELPELPRSEKLRESAEMGHEMEPIIARRFAKKFGLRTRRIGTLAHRDHPHRMVNLDRLVLGCPDGPCFLEIKTRSAYQLSEWENGVPDGPALQVTHGLGITGFSHAHVRAYVGGNWPVDHRVDRDDELVRDVEDAVDEFWQRVINRDPPPIDGSAATAELLGHLYDVEPGKVAGLDPAEVEPLLKERAEAEANIKAAAARKQAADNHLKTLLGDAEVAMCAGKKAYTWREHTTSRVDLDALRAAHPAIVSEFTLTSRVRRLHVPKEKTA